MPWPNTGGGGQRRRAAANGIGLLPRNHIAPLLTRGPAPAAGCALRGEVGLGPARWVCRRPLRSTDFPLHCLRGQPGKAVLLRARRVCCWLPTEALRIRACKRVSSDYQTRSNGFEAITTAPDLPPPPLAAPCAEAAACTTLASGPQQELHRQAVRADSCCVHVLNRVPPPGLALQALRPHAACGCCWLHPKCQS